jgi:hypothetical protein
VQIGLYRSKNPATGVDQETGVDQFTIYNRGLSLGTGNQIFGNQEFSATQSLNEDIKYTYESHLFDKDDGSIAQKLYPNEKIYCKLIIRTFGGTSNIVPLEGGQLKWGIVLNKQQDVLIPNKGTFFSNYVQNLYQIGDVVNMTRVVPRNIKQLDFLDSIIKMFNLYIMADTINPKKLFIEPRSDFYKQNEILDWSNKLDLSQNIDYTPIVDIKQKVTLTHKKAEDYYNKDYTTKTNKVFGEYQYDTSNEFSNSDIKIETIFNPTTLNAADIQNQGSETFIIPKVYNKIPVEQNEFNKVTGDIRIFIRSKQPLSTGGITYRIENGYVTTPFDVYPYVGHQDDPFNPEFDINFDTPDVVYYNSFIPTNNNLYNLYYKQFFEEIYGKDSKQVSCNVYLTPQDIIDFDYRKLIYIERISSGSPTYWRVNKIEYDAVVKQSYKVELIKVLNNVKIPNPPFKEYVNVGLRPNNTSTLVLGTNNDWLNGSVMIAGDDNLTRSSNSLIVGQKNRMGSGQNNIIVGENNSISNGSKNNFLVGGINNTIDNDIQNSGIIGGNNNFIGLSGTQSSLDGQNLIIIGGSGSTIDQSLSNVVLINPINTVATQSNTIYLEGNVLVNGTDISSVLTPIPAREIVLGNGTGITSITSLKFDTSFNLIAGSPTNTLSSTSYSLIIGGTINTIDNSLSSSMIGGVSNLIDTTQRSSIIGGFNSTINTNTDTIIIGGESNLIDTGGNRSVISGGCCNTITNTDSIIAGGQKNITQGFASSIIGGLCNCVTSQNASILGGSYNFVSSGQGVIMGGSFNTLSGQDSAIIGGNSLTLSDSGTVLVPTIRVNNLLKLDNTSGIVNISANTTTTISNSNVTSNSIIFLTAQSQIDLSDNMYVDNIIVGTSFDITFQATLIANADIGWMIVN